MINKTLIFKFGADGGGASVLRSDEGKFIETGSSGGMLDEDEDPIISWVKEFDSFEAWWKDFKQQHKQFWPFFYPIFIHSDIKAFIKKEIADFHSDDEYSQPDFESWKDRLESNDTNY